MYAVHAALIRRNSAVPIPNEAAGLLDVLWAHTRIEDGIEHMHARAGPERIDVLFFVSAPSEPHAQESALNLLSRTHGQSRSVSEAYSIPESFDETE